MQNIYKKYGFYKEGIKQITLEGIDGAEKIKETMEKLRKNPPENFGEYKVEKIKDYEKQTILDIKTKKIEKINMPKSNVLYYELSKDAWLAVRPSGTEPKLKFYYGVKGTDANDAEVKEKELGQYMINLVNSML